jgi:hypothetical protein
MTSDDLSKVLCTIDVLHESKQVATIRSLIPFHVHLTVGHRRFGVLAARIEAANKCGDHDRARQWQGNYDRLVRALAGQAALTLFPKLKARRRWFDWTLTALFIATFLMYTKVSYVMLGISTDILLVTFLWITDGEYNAREKYIQGIVATSFGAAGTDVTMHLRRKKGATNANH